MPAGIDEARVRRELTRWQTEALGAGLGHPDVWPGVVVGPLSDLDRELNTPVSAGAGGRRAVQLRRGLRRFADLIQDRLRQSPRVGKIEQIGVVQEAVYLYMSGAGVDFSALDLPSLAERLVERNLDVPGGAFELADRASR